MPEMYKKEKDLDLVLEEREGREEARDFIFKKGQSKRLWNELYKVGVSFYFLSG